MGAYLPEMAAQKGRQNHFHLDAFLFFHPLSLERLEKVFVEFTHQPETGTLVEKVEPFVILVFAVMATLVLGLLTGLLRLSGLADLHSFCGRENLGACGLARLLSTQALQLFGDYSIVLYSYFVTANTVFLRSLHARLRFILTRGILAKVDQNVGIVVAS